MSRPSSANPGLPQDGRARRLRAGMPRRRGGSRAATARRFIGVQLLSRDEVTARTLRRVSDDRTSMAPDRPAGAAAGSLGGAPAASGQSTPTGEAACWDVHSRRRHPAKGQLPDRDVAGEQGRALAPGDERPDRRRGRGASGIRGRLRRRGAEQRQAGRRRRELPAAGDRSADHLAERGGPADRRRCRSLRRRACR